MESIGFIIPSMMFLFSRPSILRSFPYAIADRCFLFPEYPPPGLSLRFELSCCWERKEIKVRCVACDAGKIGEAAWVHKYERLFFCTTAI